MNINMTKQRGGIPFQLLQEQREKPLPDRSDLLVPRCTQQRGTSRRKWRRPTFDSLLPPSARKYVIIDRRRTRIKYLGKYEPHFSAHLTFVAFLGGATCPHTVQRHAALIDDGRC